MENHSYSTQIVLSYLFRTLLFESTRYMLNNTQFKFFKHVKRMANKTTEPKLKIFQPLVMQISGDNSKCFLLLVVFLNRDLVNLVGKLSSPSEKKWTTEVYWYNTQLMCLCVTNRFYFSFRKDLRGLISFFSNLPFTQTIIATFLYDKAMSSVLNFENV